MENTLNPQALALTKAIKQHESGGKYDIKGKSEEYGAYQWTPDTWKSHAKAVLGDENADITNPTLQNKVAYSVIEKDLKSGLSPAEVSAKWNSGQPKGWENKRGVNKFGVKYDVPAYVNSVGQLYTQEYQKAKQPVVQESQVQPQSEFNPLFASNPNDSLLESSGKLVGNIIPSAFNFGKNILSAINPINTINNIKGIYEETGKLQDVYGKDMAGSANATIETLKALPNELYQGLVPTVGREATNASLKSIGINNFPVLNNPNTIDQSLTKTQQAVTEDPFGQIAPFILGARGLAEKAGVVKQFDDFIKKGVDTTLKPITAPAKFVGEKAGQVARGTVAQATGLNPETVKALIDNPELYTKTARQNLNRSAIATKVGTALDDLESQVSDTGTGYNAIRENTGVTYIAPTFLSEALKPFNIKVQNGKIITSAESTPLSTADITQLQKFVDDFGNERFLTNNAFLNARTALSDMSKYDAQKTGRLQSVSRTLREAYDAIGKEKIEGLKNLDEQFAPIKRQFELLKKDYLKKEDGEYVFKDGAVTKLANLDKVGRERILGRLEELVPDISKDIKMLKVVEDIERASGIKVGTYGKGALLGAGLLSGGVVGAIISAILTSPEIAVPLIRGYGLTKNQTAQVLMNLRLMLGETKQSGMDLLQTEIPIEQLVNKLSGKDIPNKQGGFIKNPLAQVDSTETYYRGEGGTNVAQGKSLLADGKHFAMDSEYPKGFGKVSEYTLKPNTKVLDLGDSTFAEMSQKLGIPERKYISPKDLSAIAKEKGYDVLKYNGEYKSTGKPFVHTVDLTGDSFVPKSLSQSDNLVEAKNKANAYAKSLNEKYRGQFGKMTNNEIVTLQELNSAIDKLTPSKVIKTMPVKDSPLYKDVLSEQATKFKTPEEFIKSEKNKYVYHTTTDNGIDGIINEGLSKKNADIYPHGEFPEDNIGKMVYLADTAEATQSAGTFKTGNMLRLKKISLNPEKTIDRVKGNRTETRYWGSDISPAEIEILDNGNWKPLLEYADENGFLDDMKKNNESWSPASYKSNESQLEEIWKKANK